MAQTKHLRRRAWLMAAATVVPVTSAVAVNETSTWIGGTGNWTTPASWANSPSLSAFPNNGTNTFDVIISAVGTPYSVNINTPVSLVVNSLLLSSTSATIALSSGSLTANQLTLSAGT